MSKPSYRSIETTLEPKAEKLARHTPDEWRVLLGVRHSHHGCARILHGWLEHEHHEGAPIQMTEAVYLEAVAAGQTTPLEPSPNALSPHRGRGR